MSKQNLFRPLFLFLLSGCASYDKRLPSFCLLDIKSRMCWTNSTRTEGISFEYLTDIMPHEGELGHRDFYCVDDRDVQKVYLALKRYQSQADQ